MINKIKDVSKQIMSHWRGTSNKYDMKTIQKGLEVSKLAMADEKEVHLTPYSKNILLKLSNNKKTRLMANDGLSVLDRYLETKTKELLLRFCGKEIVEYPDDPLSIENYFVDCWRNFKTGTEWRHIKPDMNAERLEAFKVFEKPFSKKDWDVDRILNVPKMDEVFSLMNKMIPNVSSSSNWVELSSPFLTKHTNVGYPFFRNDKGLDKSTGLSYGQLVDKIARSKSPRDVVDYPFIAFGRNQRQKARPILGGSRIQALVYNQLEAMEIRAYKESSPLFIGYHDRPNLKERLVRIAEFLIRNPGLTASNRDYSKYDTTVTPNLKLCSGAFTYLKTNDYKGKDIVKFRTLSTLKSKLVNGLDWSFKSIYGRIFSGEIDTNAGGGKINAIVSLAAIINNDPSWSEISKTALTESVSPLAVMGDDNLMIHSKSVNEEQYSKWIKDTFNMDIHPDKGEKGVFFLQNRIFLNNGKIKNKDKFIMITPFTRIIRAIANKERAIGLGPAGWTLATLQLLSYLIEWPELLVAVAQIFIPFDEMKLGIEMDWKQLTKLVGSEDEAAKREGKSAISTYAKIFDGDPQKVGLLSGDENPVSRTHAILRSNLGR